MGNVARSPDSFAGLPDEEDPEQRRLRLGDLLAGEFDDVDVDSASIVRSIRNCSVRVRSNRTNW